MFSSQIKTVVHGMVLGSLLSLSLPMQALAGTNKKGLSGEGSTQAQFQGGVSDGGGNVVGLALFDFYENKGTKKITLKELLALEPLTLKILNRLNKEIPATVQANLPGFGEDLKQALQNKAIYLESKEITSKACINQSMVSSPDQKVAGCQDDMEVRFYLPWLQQTDAQNRAGLIIHEMLLGWARTQFPDVAKEEIEQRVRILNRMIFAEEDIANTLGEFGLRVYTPHDMALIAAVKKELPKNVLAFCANPWVDFEASMKKYTDNDVVSIELLNEDLSKIYSLSQAFQKLKYLKGEEYAARRASLMPQYESACTQMKAIYSPVHEPRFDMIPKACARGIEGRAARDLAEWTEKNLDLRGYAGEEPGFVFASRYRMGSHMGVCPEAVWENRALSIELFNYYKYLILK